MSVRRGWRHVAGRTRIRTRPHPDDTGDDQVEACSALRARSCAANSTSMPIPTVDQGDEGFIGDDGFVDGYRVLDGLRTTRAVPPLRVSWATSSSRTAWWISTGWRIHRCRHHLVEPTHHEQRQPRRRCIFGGTGDDAITGGAGGDHLQGGADGRYPHGERRKDFVRGNSEDDVLDGSEDDDFLVGDAGREPLPENKALTGCGAAKTRPPQLRQSDGNVEDGPGRSLRRGRSRRLAGDNARTIRGSPN